MDVIRDHERLTFAVNDNGKSIAGKVLAADTNAVWFRAEWGVAGRAQFSVSTNGEEFTPLGEVFQMTSFGGFLGARIGIYTMSSVKGDGYVDVESFRYDYSR